VNIFDPNTQSFQRYENSPDNASGYHMSLISSFVSDRSHCLWMGSADGVVNKSIQTGIVFMFLTNQGNCRIRLPATISRIFWKAKSSRESSGSPLQQD